MRCRDVNLSPRSHQRQPHLGTSPGLFRLHTSHLSLEASIHLFTACEPALHHSPAFSYQNHHVCRLPTMSVHAFAMRTHKHDGHGLLRGLHPRTAHSLHPRTWKPTAETSGQSHGTPKEKPRFPRPRVALRELMSTSQCVCCTSDGHFEPNVSPGFQDPGLLDWRSSTESLFCSRSASRLEGLVLILEGVLQSRRDASKKPPAISSRALTQQCADFLRGLAPSSHFSPS